MTRKTYSLRETVKVVGDYLSALRHKADSIQGRKGQVLFAGENFFRREAEIFIFALSCLGDYLRVNPRRIQGKPVILEEFGQGEAFPEQIETGVFHGSRDHQGIREAVEIGVDRRVVIAIQAHPVELRQRDVGA